MVEVKYVVLLAIQFALPFFVFGWICCGWKEDDRRNGRKNFWLVKHYWRKIRATPAEGNEP